jgi:hypothetical protein
VEGDTRGTQEVRGTLNSQEPGKIRSTQVTLGIRNPQWQVNSPVTEGNTEHLGGREDKEHSGDRNQYTVISFVSTSAKFSIFTIVGPNGTLVEDKMRRFKSECEHFSLNKCPI